ncbi:efflux RND transporter periplasmic adaptor subunit [Cellulomonas sp. JZ18]|uniref:efflux RND transporter periplasmic adaptor subunit n=1 Tax=Cellulomonas sp. JZ18 TaxID=2654191 RepID=UPI0018AF9C44|nr:efflux RND transporter periplasmic adaptor subunit [Cellulomonas sp. JZ18]
MSEARRGRRPALAAAAAAAAVVVSAGCTPGSADGATASEPQVRPGAPATTTVARGDITSVLVLNGATVAQPDVTVRAGGAGPLDIQVEEGQGVAAGQVLGSVGAAPVVAPAAGVVTGWHVPDGVTVPADLPVADLRYTGFGIDVSVPAEHAYRLYSVPVQGTTTVTGGPGGLPCDVLPAPAGGSAAGVEAQAGARFVCLLPSDAQVMAGLEAKVGLETARAEDVLTLPVEAVTGVTGQGVVTRVEGTGHSRVTVELGVSDGHLVEVRSGLDDGDVVLAYAPGLGSS